MILASLKNNTKDGQLVLMSQDRKRYLESKFFPTLLSAVEDWSHAQEKLNQESIALNLDSSLGKNWTSLNQFLSPLPRSFQFLDGSAYLHHVALVRKARGVEMPPRLYEDPLMYQGCSDGFYAPSEEVFFHEDWGIDFESEIAVVTDQVQLGLQEEEIHSKIILVMLCNDWSLRNLIPAELEKGFGFLQGKPPSSFAPFACTPDELGSLWQNSKCHLKVKTEVNKKVFGEPNSGEEMQFSFAKLIAHAAKTRTLSAGTIVGSGTVSNSRSGVGSSCIAEVRMIEKIETGKIQTPFLKDGDQVRIEALSSDGFSFFGAIDQKVKKIP